MKPVFEKNFINPRSSQSTNVLTLFTPIPLRLVWNSSMSIVPTSGVIGEMAMKCDEVHLIGDCATLGRIREATEAGERVGRWL